MPRHTPANMEKQSPTKPTPISGQGLVAVFSAAQDPIENQELMWGVVNSWRLIWSIDELWLNLAHVPGPRLHDPHEQQDL